MTVMVTAQRVTVEWVREEAASIRLIYDEGDYDWYDFAGRFYASVLRAIAEGRCDDPPACAAEAVKLQDLADG